MLTGVFRFYRSFFYGKSFMQWAPGVSLQAFFFIIATNLHEISREYVTLAIMYVQMYALP